MIYFYLYRLYTKNRNFFCLLQYWIKVPQLQFHIQKKLCKNGCAVPSGMIAISIDRNSPVITLQISSRWNETAYGLDLKFELMIQYSKDDQNTVISKGQ